MAFPEDLLEQAEHLARREPTRPKQASLRRAISTAYYSLFHLLTTEAARNWKRESQRHALSRGFDHGPMRKACEKKRAEIDAYLKSKPAPCPQLINSRHFLIVISRFIQLQQLRHSADYDGSKQWARDEVSSYIGGVADAFHSWKAIRDDDDAQDFLLTLLLKDR